MKPRGFTLVELLAVIAIVALLVALSVPVISKIQQRATSAKFTSNLRAAGTAVLQLAAENNNAIPAFNDARTVPGHWQERVAPFLGEPFGTPAYNSAQRIQKSVLKDPADKTVYPSNKLPQRNVAINGTCIYYNNPSALDVPPRGASGRPLASIDRPARLALLGPGQSAQFDTNWGQGGRIIRNNMEGQIDRYQRYPEGLYFVFVDGHVELKTREWVLAEAEKDRAGRSAFFDTGASNPAP